MILVDTSAWIDFFKNQDSPLSNALDEFLSKSSVGITGLIQLELLQGAKDRKEQKLIRMICKDLKIFYEPPEIWETAGLLSLQLKQNGLHVRTVDMMIATMAIRSSLPLLTKDRDFSLIAKHLPLELIHFLN